jgi:hypothetical protein
MVHDRLTTVTPRRQTLFIGQDNGSLCCSSTGRPQWFGWMVGVMLRLVYGSGTWLAGRMDVTA